MLARYSLELDIVWLSTCSGSLALGVSMLVLARARVFAAQSITNIVPNYQKINDFIKQQQQFNLSNF